MNINAGWSIHIVKNTRTEDREDRYGRIRSAVVTTWDVVHDGHLLSEHPRLKDAQIARARQARLAVLQSSDLDFTGMNDAALLRWGRTVQHFDPTVNVAAAYLAELERRGLTTGGDR